MSKTKELIDFLDDGLRHLHSAKMIIQGEPLVALNEKEQKEFIFLILDIKDTLSAITLEIELDRKILKQVWDEEKK